MRGKLGFLFRIIGMDQWIWFDNVLSGRSIQLGFSMFLRFFDRSCTSHSICISYLFRASGCCVRVYGIMAVSDRKLFRSMSWFLAWVFFRVGMDKYIVSILYGRGWTTFAFYFSQAFWMVSQTPHMLFFFPSIHFHIHLIVSSLLLLVFLRIFYTFHYAISCTTWTSFCLVHTFLRPSTHFLCMVSLWECSHQLRPLHRVFRLRFRHLSSFFQYCVV